MRTFIFLTMTIVLALHTTAPVQGAPLAPAPTPHRTTAALQHQALLNTVQQHGVVRVLVGLHTPAPIQPEARLATLQAVAQQRSAIAAAQQGLLNRLAGFNISAVTPFTVIPYVAMTVDQAGLHALLDDPALLSVDEDVLLQPALAERVPLIGADAVQEAGFSGKGWTIAVLDTGVDSSHPFLQGKVVEEACFSTGDTESGARSLCPNGRDEQHGRGAAAPCSLAGCEHGTHVAGIAAGRGDDFTGIASDATIIAIQVFQNHTDSCTGDGCLNVRTSDIIRALEWVYKLRDTYTIAAVNMSFGSAPVTENENENENDTEACDRYSTALHTMVDTLRDADIVTVAATGNHSETAGISFPACLSNVISVGAANTGARSMQVEEVAPFSNSHAAVDLLAPGVDISSAVPGGAFRSLSGSSMAVPAVVGAWAVLKSSTPDATPTTLLQVLQETGVPVDDPRTATEYPRIQLNAALNALQHPTAAIPAPPRNLKARLSHQAQVALTWEHKHSADSALHLTIERTHEGSGGERWTTVDAVAGDSTTASDASELACDTRYFYHIRAFSSDGAFVYSNTTSTHTPPCAPEAAPERETRHTLYLASVRK